MVGFVVAIVLCFVVLVCVIPICAFLGAFFGALADDAEAWTPIGAFIGYIIGVVLWILALIAFILNIIYLAQYLFPGS